MTELITIKIRTPQNEIMPIQCREIVEIDGKPFEQAEAGLRDGLFQLTGRIDQLENTFHALIRGEAE